MTFSRRVEVVKSSMQIRAAFWVSFSLYNPHLDLLSNTSIIILESGNSEFKNKYYQYLTYQYL